MRTINLMTLILAVGCVSATSAANAATAVLSSPGSAVATGVNGVFVNGAVYDVTFAAAPDTTFSNNSAGAATAIGEMNTALNGSTAAFVSIPGFGSIDQFIVQTGGFGSGLGTTSNFTVGGWTAVGAVTADASTAQFQKIATVLFTSPSDQVVSAIDGLKIAGVTYNVTFGAAANSTFVGNPNAAQAALAELNTVLNATPAAFVSIPGFGSIDQFIVQTGGFGSGLGTTSNFTVGGWTAVGAVAADASTAQFTVVGASAPELGKGGLFGAGLVLFCALRYRRRARC